MSDLPTARLDHTPRLVVTADTPPPARRRVGNYDLVREVGRGGMGVVYEAHDPRLRRPAAVKMPLAAPHPDVIPRFQTEAEAMAQLAHPNIVRIYDIGWHGGLPFVACEFLTGGSLEARAANKPQPARPAAELVRTLAAAVGYAHGKGVVHRDLKPANVLFAEDGTPRVTDFGLARLAAADGTPVGRGLTQAGQVVGTPQYMSPEQARGGPAGAEPAVDVYALGAILYDLLTGRPPHNGADGFATLEAVIHTDPVPPRRLVPGLPRDLETICLTALERSPAKRYASAAALADDLGRFLAGEPIRARPAGVVRRAVIKARRRPLVAGLVAALAAVTAAGLTGITWEWRQAVAARFDAEANAVAARDSQADAESARDAEADARRQSDEQRAAAVASKADAEEQARKAELSEADARLSGTARLIQTGDLNQARMELARAPVKGWEWHHLHRLAAPEVWQIISGGPAGGQWTYLIAPDPRGGRTAIVSGDPGIDERPDRQTTLEVVTAAGKVTHRLPRAVPGTAAQLAWADADRVAVADQFGGVRVHTLSGGTVATRALPAELTVGVRSPVGRLSPDGKLFVRGSGRGELTVFDLTTLRPVGRFTPVPGRPAVPLAVHPSGLTVVKAGAEVLLLDLPAGRVRGRLPADSHAHVVSADGRRVAGLHGPDERAAVTVWDAADGTPVWGRPPVGGETGGRLDFTPDGRRLVEARRSWRKVRVWDVASGAVAAELGGHTNSVTGVAAAPDGRGLATVGNDGAVRVWGFGQPSPAVLHGHLNGVRAVAYDPTAARLYTGGMDGSVVCWDLTRGGADADPRPWLDPADRNRADYAADFGGLWTTADGAAWRLDTADGYLARFDPATHTPDRRVKMAGLTRRGNGPLTDFALDSDGRRLLGPVHSGPALPGRLVEWDTATGQAITPAPPQMSAMRAIAAGYSRDGKRAAAVWAVGTSRETARTAVRVWDRATGAMVHQQDTGPDGYYSLAFLPDGRLALGRSSDAGQPGGIDLLDPATGRRDRLTVPDPTFLPHLTVSADGRLAAGVCFAGMARADVRVYVWDLAAGKLAWANHKVGPVTGLAFSPDGERLAAARFDDRVTVWRTDAGGTVLVKAPPSERIQNASFPARVAFTADGRRLIANQASGRLCVWAADAATDPAALVPERLSEADRSAFAFHLRAALELAADPTSLGYRLHRDRLDALTPPTDRTRELWHGLPPAGR